MQPRHETKRSKPRPAPKPFRDLAALRRLAARVGIQSSYRNMEGNVVSAGPETLKALLECWGCVASSSDLKEADPGPESSSVLVRWNGNPGSVNVQLPVLKLSHCRLILEDGTTKSVPILKQQSKRNARGLSASIRLPGLPLGYHQLEFESPAQTHRMLIISAPEMSYQPAEPLRELGLFAPVYGLRSHRNWGAGDLRDWTELSHWASQCNCSVVATLPILAAFLDRPTSEPSPYSPASRLFWNDLYIALDEVPEFAHTDVRKLLASPKFRSLRHQWHHGPHIDYLAVATTRRQVLERMAGHFFSSEGPMTPSFRQFLAERPELVDYAEFRAACDLAGTAWHVWKSGPRSGQLRSGDYRRTDKNLHIYCQWLIQEQLSAFLRGAAERHQHFYLDLPLGVHSDGYDLWRYRDSFAFPTSAGAPPDAFFTKGQNWGFAPLHPRGLRERHYDYFIRFLRFQMRHTSLLRIDHIMGLHRLYWIPQGFPAHQGAYVRYPAHELLAILCLESSRHKTILVGENLGTVPPEVNEDMARHGIREIYALQYEQTPNPRKPLRVPPRRSVAGINTHDMPMFRAHLRGDDIKLRASLGLLSPPQVEKELVRRAAMTRSLTQYLRSQGLLTDSRNSDSTALESCLRWLCVSPAEIVLVTLEDLWAETEPQNVPGTSSEMPNWRRKLKLSLEDIIASPRLRRFLRSLARSRKQTRPLQRSRRV